MKGENTKMNYLAPSILAADFCRLGEQLDVVNSSGAQYVHIDVMDGMFVPSISFGMPVLASVRKRTDLFLDVHMMVERPERYIEEFIRLGADGVTIHVEACDCIEQTLQKIRQLGAKTGLAVNPDTPIDAVLPYIYLVDMVLIMTVQPGFGGQKYMTKCLDKIRALREIVDSKYPDVKIEIDGGVRLENLKQNLDAGANVIVTGSAVFKGNISENIRGFLEIMS